MKRSTFIKYIIPSAWALQACVKDEAQSPQPSAPTPQPQLEPKIDINLEFPSTVDFLIAGALNPIRFSALPAQEVEVQLMNLQQDTVLATSKGTNEAWLKIPVTKVQTKYALIIHKTVFEITCNPPNGEPVSLKQYEKQFAEGKTIAIVETNEIPFALKQNPDKTFTALDMNCTHNGCPIQLMQTNKFECECHGSKFDEEGKVTNGPAVDNLRTFAWQYFPLHQVVVVQNR
jgi:Rieske Fe-S protein